MPLCTYRCPTCKHEVELNRAYPAGTVYCPACEWKGYETEMKRVYDVPNISFVGRGFHCNDYHRGYRREV